MKGPKCLRRVIKKFAIGKKRQVHSHLIRGHFLSMLVDVKYFWFAEVSKRRSGVIFSTAQAAQGIPSTNFLFFSLR